MNISQDNFSLAACEAIYALQKAGGKVYVVGGYVRDTLMGVEPKDIDLLVTELPAEQVSYALKGLDGFVNLTGKDFGVFRYRYGNDEVEIALPRLERSTGDTHKDFDVTVDHKLSVEIDLGRRDFTINAMAYDLRNEKLIDPYNGKFDIKNNYLRAVSNKSIQEDSIRILRGLVLMSRYRLTPVYETADDMANYAFKIDSEPSERIQMELDKIFEGKHVAYAIRMSIHLSILKWILPEVNKCVGFNQNNPWHDLPLGDHLVKTLERVCEINGDPDVRLAALLHDIGKPLSVWVDPETGSNHYYKKVYDDGTTVGDDHEELGAVMTEKLMKRLGYPNDRIERVSNLVRFHMYAPFSTTKGARKFLNRVGDYADDLLDIRWADQDGKSDYPTDPMKKFSVKKEKELLEEVRKKKEPTNLAMLAINGNDLIELGMPQGPGIGKALRGCVELVLSYPALNDRDTLLRFVKALNADL
jgi:tRNA nucleotidyltransferase (CCA-adding enzyme)